MAYFDGSGWRPLGSNGKGGGPWVGDTQASRRLRRATVAPGGAFTGAGGDAKANFAASRSLLAKPRYLNESARRSVRGHNVAVARILFGITGGIAAYKACELVRLLVKAGHDVLPLPTRGSERFVRAETFFALARKSPSVDPYPHLARADLLVIAPLTAHTLAKLAHGLADDVLTEAALAHRGPVLVAPAMNTRMWEHEATQANAATLRARGVELIGPEAGELAEGEVGLGRMTEPEEIAARIEELLGDSRRRPSPANPSSSARVARASRSTPSASSGTALRAGWASRSPSRRGAGAPR